MARDEQVTPDRARRLAAALRLLSHPVRFAILLALADAEASTSGLMAASGGSHATTNAHLRLLCRSGLAERRRDGASVIYSLTDAGRDLVAAALSAIDQGLGAVSDGPI
jgi:ArsR family transcriptional regulator